MRLVFIKRKLSLRFKSWKVWTIMIALCVGIFIVFLMHQPSIGTVKMLLLSDGMEPNEEDALLFDKARQEAIQKAIKTEEKESGRVGYGSYRGKHISFRYPNSYFIQTSESSTSGTLERVILLGSGVSLRKLAITATTMINAGSLEEVSGVTARRLKPKIYQEKPLEVSGKKGILFEKTEGGYEKTVFSLAGQILTTIALTSPNRDTDLDIDYDFIVKEFTLL